MALRALAIPAVLTAALLLPVPVAVPAAAGGRTVTVADHAFTPATVRVALGGSVTWSFMDQVAHTSTSDQGFWDSGSQRAGDTYARVFVSAGTFGYTCTFHPSMRGKVRVPIRVSGTAADGWTLRWATRKAGPGRDYDLQVRRPGSNKWRFMRRDTSRPKTRFAPARSGTWRFRARSSNTDAGESSGWSPTRKVTVA